MLKKLNNFAFIDVQNVYLSVKSQGWKIDWVRFRIYLKEKHGVQKAYLFIGYIDGNNSLYSSLQEAGFICIFKPTLIYKNGKTKGNCDAELVLQAMIDFKNYEKAVIVTGDGDFYCLIKHLISEDKLQILLIPNQFKFSALLKLKEFGPFLRYMNELKDRLSYKKI